MEDRGTEEQDGQSKQNRHAMDRFRIDGFIAGNNEPDSLEDFAYVLSKCFHTVGNRIVHVLYVTGEFKFLGCKNPL